MMDIKEKYPVENWILSQRGLNKGDLVVYFCPYHQREVTSTIVHFPRGEKSHSLECKRLENGQVEVVNFYDNIVFLLKKSPEKVLCTCGAKHTSNPHHHLAFCDLH